MGKKIKLWTVCGHGSFYCEKQFLLQAINANRKIGSTNMIIQFNKGNLNFPEIEIPENFNKFDLFIVNDNGNEFNVWHNGYFRETTGDIK